MPGDLAELETSQTLSQHLHNRHMAVTTQLFLKAVHYGGQKLYGNTSPRSRKVHFLRLGAWEGTLFALLFGDSELRQAEEQA